jgi:hypothetical protein
MSAGAEALFPFSDLTLARRLERAEAHGSAEFVEARARIFPASGARWIEVAGAQAMYDGVASPITQTFGLGIHQKATSSDLDAIEAFFKERGAPVFHEISPLADPTLFGLLNERGYQPFEFTSILYRPIRRGLTLAAARNERLRVRPVQGEEEALFAATAAKGWSEFPEVAGQVEELMQVNAATRDALRFLAELDGRAIGTGVLFCCEGVALLAGASTIPEARKQGAQLALLESRLRAGAEAGCDLAMMGAAPGSASQRNAERHGFRIAYTRIKWRLPQRPA